MRPTHFLISYEDMQMLEKYYFNGDNPIDSAIPVDLSEEGIKEKAEAYIREDDEHNPLVSNYPYSRDGAKWFYQQCAKDILNSKP